MADSVTEGVLIYLLFINMQKWTRREVPSWKLEIRYAVKNGVYQYNYIKMINF